MKVFKQYWWAVLIVGTFMTSYAQENVEVFKKHHNFYFSFGAGSSLLRQLQSTIYFHNSNNLQLGVIFERAINKRFSLISGIEFEHTTYNFDGDLQFKPDGGLNIIEAGPDKKYTGIRQVNVAIPVQGRYYFLKNLSKDARNIFLQGGLRVTQSLDFLGIGTSFYYRSLGDNKAISLSHYTHQTGFQCELMLGFKGQFFKKFDLLNSSTLGFMYQINPMFQKKSSQVFPLHFTWRFLF
jgi:hypothetical protein